MTDWRIFRLTQELQKHDRCLFAKKTSAGMTQVWRMVNHWASADLDTAGNNSRPTQFIFALTHDWSLTGQPVDWGIEPVMHQILERDLWSKVSYLADMRKQRERNKDIKEQSTRNEIRARAADMRKEFAQATNEINTSNLEKVEKRRTKWH